MMHRFRLNICTTLATDAPPLVKLAFGYLYRPLLLLVSRYLSLKFTTASMRLRHATMFITTLIVFKAQINRAHSSVKFR